MSERDCHHRQQKQKRIKYDIKTAPFGGDLPKKAKNRVVGTKYQTKKGEIVIAMKNSILSCPCGKARSNCKKCGGGSLCPCGKLRSLCAKCGGGSLCPCGKVKRACLLCFTGKALVRLVTKRLRNALNAPRYKHFYLHVHQSTANVEALLGCTIQKFQCHIESQFTDDMTWGNHGSNDKNNGTRRWHIDHIRPVCTFDLADATQRHECFHYLNTQPMWATENMQKSRKTHAVVPVLF